jgi:hypothetical protein
MVQLNVGLVKVLVLLRKVNRAKHKSGLNGNRGRGKIEVKCVALV